MLAEFFLIGQSVLGFGVHVVPVAATQPCGCSLEVAGLCSSEALFITKREMACGQWCADLWELLKPRPFLC